jgi:hypothetical protein
MHDPNPAIPSDSLPTRPSPLQKRPLWPSVGKAGVILVGGGSLFVLTCVMLTPSLGAQRSTQLQWEQRQQETHAAIAESDAKPDRPKSE